MNKLISTNLTIWAIIIFTLSVGAASVMSVLKNDMQGFPGNKYEKEWKVVDSLENLRLSKQASEQVQAIYVKAKSEQNTPQIIKTLIHKLKYKIELEEDAYETFIVDLDREIVSADPILQSILYSIKAELIWSVYQQDRWQINERTVTDAKEDMASWDAQKFMDESRKYYMLSLENESKLKEVKIEFVEDILLVNPTSRELRPTLFDLLAHRAVDHFMTAEANLNKPIYAFELDNPELFRDYIHFAKIKISTEDSLSKDVSTILLLQRIISFHTNSGNTVALIDADLKRLQYVYDNYVGVDKDKLLMDAFVSLEARFKGKKESAVVKLKLAELYNNLGSAYQASEFQDDIKFYKKKAADLCIDIITNYPGSRVEGNAKNLLMDIKIPSVSFTTEKVLSPDVSNLMLLQYQNVNKAYFKLVKVNYDDFRKQEDRYSEEFKSWLGSQSSIKNWEQQIPNDGLFHAHNVELEISPLKKGFYVLMVNDSNDFSATSDCHYSPFFVSNLSFINRSAYGKGIFEAIILDRNFGTPIKKANVQLFKRVYDSPSRKYKNVLITTLKSDSFGRVSYTNESYNYENFYFTITTSDDYLVNDDYQYIYKFKETPKSIIRTSFFTDRGIYRPGQTIYFKGIKIKSDGKNNELVINTTTDVIFKDANGQEITKLKLPVNEFGSFQGSFTIPLGLATGTFFIMEADGTKNIQVEEYKRPKYEVTINKPSDVFRVNDIVTIKGNAKALAGFNITDAKVQYRVYRTANYPLWYRSWYPMNSEEQEITFGKTKTDDKGEFSIDFVAIPDKSVTEEFDPTFNYRISVEVTDEAGETRTAEESISAGYKTLTISAFIPKLINGEDVKPWKIIVSNLNGKEQKQPVNIKVERLQKPERIYRSKLWAKPDVFIIEEVDFKKKFPNDIYKNDNSNLLIAAEEVVYNNVYNTDDSVGFVSPIKTLKSGWYRTTITTKDPFGKDVKTVYFFDVFNEKEKASPIQTIFEAYQINSVVEPGSEAKFYITTTKKIKVLYEIEHDGKIIKKEMISLNNEQRVISIPILEEYRGNIHVSFSVIYQGRSYLQNFTVVVPYTNKQLNFKLESFRDKMLPGSKEEWKLNVTAALGSKQASELLLGMYDASLDAFVSNSWFLQVWNSNSRVYAWTSSVQAVKNSEEFNYRDQPYYEVEYLEYENINWFGLYINYGWGYEGRNYRKSDYRSYYDSPMEGDGNGIVREETAGFASPSLAEKSRNKSVGTISKDEVSNQQGFDQSELRHLSDSIDITTIPSAVKARSNFSETAFFFPQIITDENGNAIFSFTMPESLTKWKFMGLAHTKSLQVGTITQEVVTQKELMINTFAPRFLREGDELFFTGKITNLTEKELSGKAILELRDPLTDKIISSKFGLNEAELSFTVKPGQSVPAEWKIKIPFEQNLVKYSVKAISGNFSDGEENIIPILTNRMLVTETVPLWVNGNDTRNFSLLKLNSPSPTQRNYKLTLEFTSNPAWYAIQSLPYLMEYPYECAEQTFSRLYANSIATHIANSDPKIKSVFDVWKNYQSEALQSNLEKNEELKNILLEETPWVRQANNELERKRRVGILFDINRMTNEIKSNEKKLFDMQLGNGGFPWFKGGPDDRYITQHIVTGFGKLNKLGIARYDANKNPMIKRAVLYLDQRIAEDYKNLIKYKANLKDDNLSHIQIHYLYARSFFKNVPIDENCRTEVAYYMQQAEQYWNKKDDFSMGMLALAMHRAEKKTTAKQIVASLKDRSIYNEELGMYWKGMLQGGYYWYNAPIETMALMIEAFDEVSADLASVNSMRRWLIKNKQTNDWKTTKATADASYALLLQGTDLLLTGPEVDISFGKNGEMPLDLSSVKSEAGTGYFKTDFRKDDIKPQMANIRVTKKTVGPGFGSLYWQYFEDIDKVTKPATPNPLSVTKKLFREVKTATGLKLEEITSNTKLETGDRIISRIIFNSDRPMEYVHLKDMRASGLEPENVLSQYKWQQGLGYYESTKDVATHFFISYVPRGTYIFEYPSRVTHKGNFSNGITQVQCMYAPEFTFHSEGIRIKTM